MLAPVVIYSFDTAAAAGTVPEIILMPYDKHTQYGVFVHTCNYEMNQYPRFPHNASLDRSR